MDQDAVDGWIPGDIPLKWNRSLSWRNEDACADRDVVSRRNERFSACRQDFSEKVTRGLERLRTEILCPVGKSIYVNCTLGELNCLQALQEIPEERLNTWSGVACVDPALWVWDRSQFRIESWFLRKNGPYWSVFCKNERRFCLKNGRAISHHCLATFGLEIKLFRLAFARLTCYCRSLGGSSRFYCQVSTDVLLPYAEVDGSWVAVVGRGLHGDGGENGNLYYVRGL